MTYKQPGLQFRKLCQLIPFSVALSGITVLAYQSTLWLKQGYWKSLGTRVFLNKVIPTNFLQWLHHPKSWLGLNKIISPIFDLPLALFLLLFGLIVTLLIAKAFDLLSKSEKIKKMDIEKVSTISWRSI
ncbi:MAG: hypothetical protein GY845_06425 [Planctomycetes bacterium]|nr:hypothetical protein [Planctomycetota bacterium]